MTSYNRYNQDAQGRRVWPIPGFPINTDTFDSGWWVWSTGTNWTIGSSMHNELRFGIQHSGDTNEVGRQAEFFELNGIVNGQAARFYRDWFFNVSVINDVTTELRRVPTPVAPQVSRGGDALDTFGDSDQSPVQQ